MVDQYWRRLREKSSVLLSASWTLSVMAVLLSCVYTCSCLLRIFELARPGSPLLAKAMGGGQPLPFLDAGQWLPSWWASLSSLN